MNKEIEEVASWPWRRRYAYAVAYGAIQEETDMEMPDTNVGSGNANIPASAKANMPSGVRSGTNSDVPPSVAKHDHVMNVQN